MKVQMAESSPIVPSESHIHSLPVFPTTTSPRSFTMREFFPRTLYRNTTSSLNQNARNYSQTSFCQCPHVLVSDDDHFQNFYYETLFQRSISWEEILGDKEGFRFEIYTSGEDLIHRYQGIQNCGCGKLALIITDYEMGYKRLNGVETIIQLRRRGYSGSVVLRTSEEKEQLMKNHDNFGEMLESEFINSYIMKQSFKEAKETIQSLIKSSRY